MALNITAGILDIPQGGTNAGTAQEARINLLPSLSGNSGKVLAVNTSATDFEYIPVAGGGAILMYLPTFASTSLGEKIYIQNLHLTWATNNFTIARSDTQTRIMLLQENLICNTNVGGIVLMCVERW